MTIRSTSGISVSVCQTVIGATPEIFVSAAIMSRSRLRPGSWTTADFMAAVQTLLGIRRVLGGLGGFRYGRGDVAHGQMTIADYSRRLEAHGPDCAGCCCLSAA